MTNEWKRRICLAWLLIIPQSGNAATPMIAAGNSDSLFLNSDGSVWGTGSVTNFQNVDLSPYIGTSILVGYGTSPDEMVANACYRTIFTVTQPATAQ